MVDQSIIDYINRLRSAGYDAGTIRTQLIQAGYDPRQVDIALKYSDRPARVISAKVIALIGVGILALIIIIFVALTLVAPEPKTIDLTIRSTQTSFAAGDKLTFVKQLSSEQDVPANVRLVHTITDLANQDIATKQETVTVGRQLSTQTQISLPPTLPSGQYTVTTIATYDSKTAQAQFSFSVEEAPPIIVDEPETPAFEPVPLDCPLSCDDLDACTQDACVQGVCQHTPIRPCCGNLVCETGENRFTCAEDCVQREKTPEELIFQAGETAASDIDQAEAICKSLGTTPQADACYAAIALGSQQPTYCTRAQSESAQDRCYLQFATELKDYSSCSLIVNIYFQKSCYSLSKIGNIQAPEA